MADQWDDGFIPSRGIRYKTKMNPNGLSTGVVRVMGRCESRQWRSVMAAAAAATTASPEMRLITARTIVRVSTATNVMISIINQKRDDLDHQSII
jgi:hypothetical protein